MPRKYTNIKKPQHCVIIEQKCIFFTLLAFFFSCTLALKKKRYCTNVSGDLCYGTADFVLQCEHLLSVNFTGRR